MLALTTLFLSTSDADAFRGAPSHRATSALVVVDQSGAVERLFVDDRFVLQLGPEESRRVDLPVGPHELSVSYEQLGVERTLLERTVWLDPHEQERLELRPPTSTWLRVHNATGVAVDFRVPALPTVPLPVGVTRDLELPVGTHQVQLWANGRVVASDVLALGAFADSRWEPHPAPVGDVVVHNPHPIPLILRGQDGRDQVVSAHQSARFEGLPEGSQRWVARRLSGETVDVLSAQVRRFDTSTVRIDTPQTGLVRLVNDHGPSVVVSVDGRLQTIGSRESETLELGVGLHWITFHQGRRAVQVVADPFVLTTVDLEGGRAVAELRR